MTANNHANELAALTAKLNQLEAEVATLKAQQAAPTDPMVSNSAPENRSSRRRMLKKLALSAAGVAAAGTALAAGTQNAAAASGSLPAGGLYAFPGTGTLTGLPTGSVGLAGTTAGTGSFTGGASDNANAGVIGFSTLNNAYGVYGITSDTATGSAGVYGVSTLGFGVRGVSDSNNGVFGVSNSSFGVNGISTSSIGVGGISTSSNGVNGSSNTGIGVNGSSLNGSGVAGFSSSGYGGAFTSTNKSPLYLVPGSAGTPAATGRQKGELFVSGDATGKLLFFNGTAWVDLTAGGGGGTTTGTLTFFNVPGRYLDSRGDANNYVIPGQPQPIPAVFPAFTPIPGQPPPAASVIKYKITGAAPKGGGQIIPTSAKGIIGNITVVPPATPPGAGYVVIWPDGGSAPATSIVNYNSGQVVANSFVVALPINGIINIAVAYPTSIIIDVAGWFS